MQARRKSPTRTRSERLLEVLGGASEVVVLTHDNPDPDGIAAGWGVCTLVQGILGVPTRLLAGGVITRAENRTLVEVLKPPLQMIDEWLPPAGAAFVVVDTMSPPRLAVLSAKEPLAGVIDHHGGESGGSRKFSFRFRDIRPAVLATSSMVCGYLREQKVYPSAALATALTYGILRVNRPGIRQQQGPSRKSVDRATGIVAPRGAIAMDNSSWGMLLRPCQWRRAGPVY